MPNDIRCKDPSNIKTRGDYQFKQNRPIIAIMWKDTRNLSVISTIHDDSVGHVSRLVNENGTFSRKDIVCPTAIVDYIGNMEGVDTTHQYIQYYSYNHRTLKWPKKCFLPVF